jgi:2'-5' RNA ligase
VRTVELLLDETAERAVRGAWRRLADAGLPSQARHRSPANSPHLTLAACPELTAPIRWELAEVAAALPLPVRFTGVIRFERPTSVLAWALDLDSALAGVHRRVWETVVSDSPPGTLNPFHEPGRWIPHITLGRTRRAGAFADRRVPEALPTPPPSARLVTLRSYDTEAETLETLEPPPLG